MPEGDMNASRWVVAACDTDVMVSESTSSSASESHDDADHNQFNQSLAWTLRRFQDRFGSSWVPGRVILSSDALQFRPRETESEGSSPTPIALHFDEVIDISTEARLFSKTVRVALASGQVLTFRCRAPEGFAEQLRTVAGAVRALSA